MIETREQQTPATELPSGTVTFLFTDIEGSTQRWEHDPAAMAPALARHDSLLHDAVVVSGGQVFKTIGDAVCAAFPSAPPALAAALAAQRALDAEAWGELGELRVRMAVHTGTVDAHAGDYLGPPLNRVARLLSAGYGGQVLVSHATQLLVRQSLPAGASLRDLGEHRLRDLLEPEHVFQLLAPDLLDAFPPLKSLERHPTNLPVQPTPLVDRAAVVAEVEALLGRDDVRLVTLTGVGGTGKTRLGLQVAAELLERFSDGAYFVDLSGVADPALVLPTIAATLGVRETGGGSLHETLVSYLTGKNLLLVLDNFEQVLPAASVVAELLAACTEIKILVTSRARLLLRAEHEFLVPTLTVPDPAHLPPLAALATVAAVALFVQRATAARHDFALTEATAGPVAAIVARLDGLPLAIELAAARVRALPPPAILARLTSRLTLLTGGARDLPERQRTLRATIDWSHGLMAAEEQTLFRRLAVFAGGFSLEAAEAVATTAGNLDLDVLDGVTTLVDQSLLRQEDGPDGEARFTMLETLREFGLERLEAAGEVAATRRAHAAWCLALAEEARPHLMGPEQAVWLARLEAEHDNFRAALAVIGDDGETNLRIVGALWRFWYVRGHFSEGRAWLERALARTDVVAPAARAVALNGAGSLAYTLGDFKVAQARFEESLLIGRTLDNKVGLAHTLNNLAILADEQGDYARAEELHGESLTLMRVAGDQLGIARSLNNLGTVAHMQANYTRAASLYEESLAIRRTLGSPDGVATALHNLGAIAHAQGAFARAEELHAESLELMRGLGDKRGVAVALNNLGELANAQGDLGRSARCHDENLDIVQELGDKRSLVDSLAGVASLAASLDDAEGAARLVGASAALRETVGAPATPDDRERTERTLAAARTRLGEAALTAAVASGRTLGVEPAVAAARAVLEGAKGALSPAAPVAEAG